MSLITIHKPDFLVSGERDRLILVVSDTSKENRITSSMLAVFMSVDEFAKALLSSIGVRLGKTSKVECFTEIVLKTKDKTSAKIRPDGLVVVTTGKKRWSALIEAKIGKAEINSSQIEDYLDLAKEHNIDAVITVSNQFVATPTHLPIAVNKTKLRSTELFHWSWTYLITEAVMWVKYHGVNDPDQAYILEELIRYMQHKDSGVASFDRMNGTWKEACNAVQNNMPLKKTSFDVLDSVGSWHQFVRNLSLHMGLAIGENTTVYLKKAHKDDAKKRLEDDAAQFANDHTLAAEFDISGAAGRITLLANAKTRSVTVSMRLQASRERETAKGRINWLVKQLKNTSHPDIAIRANWPGRAADTMAKLATLQQEGILPLLCDNPTLKPTAFEVVLTRDLGAKFKVSKTFIQGTEPLLLEFYEHAGQYLKDWVAPPPKIKTKNTEALIEDVAFVDEPS